jgi:parvulin-like peptidyl-prolyl isomerase
VQFRDLISDGTFTVQTRQIFKDKDPELYNEARKLKVGERSGVIQAGNAYHILQLDAYVPEKQLSFEEIKGPLKDRLKAERQVQRFQEWEGELKKDAKIEILDASLR